MTFIGGLILLVWAIVIVALWFNSWLDNDPED